MAIGERTSSREVRAAVPASARRVQADAERGGVWFSGLARAGIIAKGVSYGIVGILALMLALGEGGRATSREGALATLAREPFGKVLLALLALGFAAYGLWRLLLAIASEVKDDEKLKGWGERGVNVVRSLIYAGLTFGALKILLGSGGSQSETGKARETTGTVLSWPGGTWLVGITGLIIVGVGLWNAYQGITRKFEEEWRTDQMSQTAQTWGRRAGVAGHLSRAGVFSLIGIFVVKAAVEYEPREAIGLDGALSKLANAAYGPVLLGITAAGLICYALYCFVDARYTDVSASDAG
jgi:Domain of Unknown Function (DUF1206)